MALRVQAANRPIFDGAGFFHGAIVAVKPQPSTDRYKSPRFRWTIEGPGTVRSMGFHFSTPSELAPVLTVEELASREEEDNLLAQGPQEELGEEDTSPNVNLSVLAQVCLALQLITLVDLDCHLITKTIEKLDLEAAIGLAVKCKLTRRSMTITEGGIERTVSFVAPVIETLSLDT